MSGPFNFNLSISFNPFSYELLIGREEAYKHITDEIQQPQQQPIQQQLVNNVIDQKKGEELSKELLEKHSQGDLSAQNHISSIRKQQEVIVIDDESEPTAEQLLNEFTRKVASGLDVVVAEMIEAGDLLTTIVESIEMSMTLLNEEKAALFKSLVEEVMKERDTSPAVVAAVKRVAVENVEAYAEALKKLSALKENEVVVEVKKEVVVDNSAEELRLKNLQDTSNELIEELKSMSKNDLGVLWFLLVLDDEGRQAERKQMQEPHSEVTTKILSFLDNVKAEERNAFLNTFTNEVEKLNRR
jgi:hypothetical protein